ncbi:DUF1566 domain-containing protein [Aureispira]|nr:DUF1566 domain-containing protein [Aureispira sp.]
MKKVIIIVSILLGYLLTISAQGVKIGNNTNAADPSAMLDVESVNKGVLHPRMTESQRDAIASPAIGLLIFQTDGTSGFYYYSGTSWMPIHTGATLCSPIVCAMTASSTVSLGTLTANYTGGTPPYGYVWDGAASSATTSTVTGMPPGTYNLTVTDVNGCTATANTSWSCGLIVNVSGAVGSLTASVSNGVGPYSYSWDGVASSQTTSTVTGIPPGTYNVTVTDAYGCTNTDDGASLVEVNGCTDSMAFNYNPLANTDDGSCIAVVNGCTDSMAFNYNPLANTDDGSCIAVVNGCTDSIALNYNPLANVVDGSCCYLASASVVTLPYSGVGLTNCGNGNNVTQSNSGVSSWYLTGEDAIYVWTASSNGQVLVDLTNVASTYSGLWVFDDCPNSGGATVVTSATSSSGAKTVSFNQVSGTTYYVVVDSWTSPYCHSSFDLSIVAQVPGCINATACNYNSLATIDDGSCDFSCVGCTDSTACNYDPLATIDGGSCDFSSCIGCTDTLAYNYDVLAITDDGSCLYGCPAPTTVVTLPYSGIGLINCGNGNNVTQSNSGVSSLYFGGEDAIYEWTASSNDLVLVDLTNVLGNQYTGLWVFDDCPSLGGATVVTSATSSSGPESVWFNQITGTTYYIVVDSWIGFQNCNTSFDLAISIGVLGCINSTACNYDNNATIDDGSCDFSCLGCMDSTACNYDPLATIDDGSCDFSCLGCTDSMAFNYDPLATIDDGSCIAVVNGCTNPTAANYNANANVDDGSCLYPGCMDSTACNYDNNANVDDGSCSGLLGCTIVTASNYNSSATCDDGSCIVYGCTDPSSPNYNPLANTDDGSCISIGDTYQGGIIFYLDGNGGGLIAAPSDQSTYEDWATAVNLCANYTGGGYSDWFLPSKDELNQMYLNKTAIGGFSNYIYWSSTEVHPNSAWTQNFDHGGTGLLYQGYTFNVRAIRAF